MGRGGLPLGLRVGGLYSLLGLCLPLAPCGPGGVPCTGHPEAGGFLARSLAAPSPSRRRLLALAPLPAARSSFLPLFSVPGSLNCEGVNSLSKQARRTHIRDVSAAATLMSRPPAQHRALTQYITECLLCASSDQMGMAPVCVELAFWAGGQGWTLTRNREEITHIRGPRPRCPGCSCAGVEGLPEWGWQAAGCWLHRAHPAPRWAQVESWRPLGGGQREKPGHEASG